MLVQFPNNPKRYAIKLIWSKAASLRRSISQQKVNKFDYGFYNKKQSLLASTVKSDKSTISIAGLLALKYANLIFITDRFQIKDQENNDNVWLCIINNHEVVASRTRLRPDEDSDYIISGDMVLADINRLKVIINQLEDHFKESFKILVDSKRVLDIPPVEKINLEDTLNELSEHEKKVTIHKLQENQKTLIKVAVIAIVCVGAWYSYKYYQQQSTPHSDNNLLQMAKQKAMQKTIKEKQYFDQLVKNNSLNRATLALNKIIANVKDLPLFMNGWQLTSIGYDAAKFNQLDLGVTKQYYSNLNQLHKLTKKLNIIGIYQDDQAQNAQIILKLPSNVNNQKQLDINSLKKHIALNKTQSDFISALQTNSIDYQISKNKALKYGLSSRSFTVKGASLHSLIKLAQVCEPFLTFTLTTASIKLSNQVNFNWNIKGNFYG